MHDNRTIQKRAATQRDRPDQKPAESKIGHGEISRIIKESAASVVLLNGGSNVGPNFGSDDLVPIDVAEMTVKRGGLARNSRDRCTSKRKARTCYRQERRTSYDYNPSSSRSEFCSLWRSGS